MDKDFKLRLIVGAIIAAIIVALVVILCGGASCQRSCTDIKSNLQNGLERTVTVYTANGDVIAEYHGKIDIADADGGYVKFDFEGKRYIYYNCFVESIADIN